MVATPYHRNADAILDSHQIMSGPPAQARLRLEERGVTHVVICPDLSWLPYVSPMREGSLYRDLVNGAYPPWVEELPAPADGIRILELTPPA